MLIKKFIAKMFLPDFQIVRCLFANKVIQNIKVKKYFKNLKVNCSEFFLILNWLFHRHDAKSVGFCFLSK